MNDLHHDETGSMSSDKLLSAVAFARLEARQHALKEWESVLKKNMQASLYAEGKADGIKEAIGAFRRQRAEVLAEIKAAQKVFDGTYTSLMKIRNNLASLESKVRDAAVS